MQHNMTLVEAHDTDSDHEVGGQDLPYLITAKYLGSFEEAKSAIRNDAKLGAFNIQASERLNLPGHIEFCTFEDYLPFFGLKPAWTPEREATAKYCQRTYVKTVGELRKAIAQLPDDFPIIHSGEGTNRQGICVYTADYWQWVDATQSAQRAPSTGWSLRLTGIDPSDWTKLITGAWKNSWSDGYEVQFSDIVT